MNVPPPSVRSPRRRFDRLLALAPVVLYGLCAAAWFSAGVGYQTDEGLYVESAAFVLHGGSSPSAPVLSDWVAAHGRRWPLMVMPYVGTVKALVALPLFAIFGVNPVVARISGILLGGLGIAGLLALLAARVRPAAGLLAGSLLAVHPSYLDFTVFDNGGASVWMGAMGLLALALTHHLSRGSKRSAFLLGAAAGAGIWGRANFLWLIAAAVVGAVLGFGRAALPRRNHFLAIAAGGLFGGLPLLAYEAGSRLGTWSFFLGARNAWSPGAAAARLRMLAQTLVGDVEQRAVWAGPAPPAWQWKAGAVLLLLAAASFLVPAGAPYPDLARWRRALAAAAATLTVLLATSRLPVAEHHLVAILPLAAAAVSVGALEAFERRAAIRPVIAALLSAWALVSLAGDARTVRGLARTGGRGFWSSALDDAARYLRAHPVPVSRLKIVSWGLQKNLYISSGTAVYGKEIYWNATRQRAASGLPWDAELRDGGTFLLMTPSAGAESLDGAADGFARALRDYSGSREERVFRDTAGEPVVRLIEIPPQP
ncbi:MAG TPA: glycosyltransferase family 39 protein [Thermoanaerobaculia bacterium]|nr:glycosyltransferase family 39 protein [Thermoanaerobaculia bacterium]